MSHAIDNVGKVALGLVGVVVLTASANFVSILAEAVSRAVRQGYNYVTNAKTADVTLTTTKERWDFSSLTPYSTTKDWQELGMAAALNLAVATVSAYVVCNFCPRLVVDANRLIGHVVPIQITPNHIPLTRLFGL